MKKETWWEKVLYAICCAFAYPATGLALVVAFVLVWTAIIASVYPPILVRLGRAFWILVLH